MNREIKEYLTETLELTGKPLTDMQSIIKTESDLSKLKQFVIDNDGKWRSRLQLVHMYIKHLQEQSTYTKQMFVSDYSQGKEREALSNVFQANIEKEVINKVQVILEDGLTLSRLYDRLVEYRKTYNPKEAVKLVSLLHKKITQNA